MLVKVSPNITYEHKMELRIAPIFHSLELLPLDAIFLAVEKSSCVLRDKVMTKW